ncbi:MAG TPA: glycoside hydrolase family 3 C-terminal domain-containing protein, partial [Anaerolineales bacterium]|nr:glycoside hydrolase family 3 C-terminal domain-containing protein [Anaerolineales bacterium]
VFVLILFGNLFRASQSRALADTPPWMDASLAPEQRAKLLLAAMTEDEKLAMVYGNNMGSAGYVGHIPANTRLGIPELNLEDGPAGVSDGMIQVSAFPAPIAVAASWDTGLMERYGVAMAEEELAKGANVQLAPMMNIDRVPMAGRNFEGFGEDPYLSAQMAAADVRGIQSTGVIATAKHFIDNDQEYQRTTISSEIDIRTQHEIYLPPFKASVDAGVGAIMCSYNRVNGVYACENPDTQNTLLKGELGFSGWIMSDWGATHSAAASALNGLDMEMPTGINFLQLKPAVDSGQVPAGRLDDMVLRILTPMFRMGLFDHGPAGMLGVDAQTPAHKQLAREAAAQGIVLLKNDGSILPLDASKIHTLAVFGAAADAQPVIAGGGSGHVTPPYIVSPLQGITARAGNAVTVLSFNALNAIGSPIPAQYLHAPNGAAGLQAQIFNTPDLSGNPVLTRNDPTVDFAWTGGAPAKDVDNSSWSARWSGSLTATVSGKYNLSLTSTGGSRLYIDDKLVIDNWGDHPEKTVQVKRRLTAGQAYAIRVEYAQTGGTGDVHLTWFKPDDDPNQEAAAMAAKADVAIVVVGANSGEGADRQDLDVSDDALLAAVAKANPNVVVVVYNPAQVLLPWADQVPAIVLGWIPGQEAGNALADVLFGDVNPSGKLPMTFAKSAGDYPANSAETYPGVDGRVLYSEGLEVGYRYFDSQHLQPLYPFGYGLSYTTFEYTNLSVSPLSIPSDGKVTVSVDVRNSGPRAGAEVAQLYLGFPSETGEPPRQLKGFQKVDLQPGETKTLSFTLSQDAYSFWSAGLGRWVAYPGSYEVMVGSSSRDIRQTGAFSVGGNELGGDAYQAEAATLAGGAKAITDGTGYTGTGFVAGFDAPGASASFKVNAAETGDYTLTIHYSSTLRPGDQNTPRTLSLYVNGSKTGQASLPNLANWNMWDFQTQTVTLNAGENTISYQYDAGDSGDVHLDVLTVARVVPTTPTPSGTGQAAGKPVPNSPVLLILLLALAVVFILAVVFLIVRSRKRKESRM